MRGNDQQHGKPLRAYRDTKANIAGLGLGAGDEGCAAYANDTDEFGTFDGAAWSWSKHDLLGTRHSDTTTDAVTRGSLIYGNATPAWDELVYPGDKYHLQTKAGDVSWQQNITMADGATIGIGAVAYIVFDAAGDIAVMGANFGIGTMAPAASALVELSSTTGALLLTRMTTAQKNALGAVNGMVVYDTTLNRIEAYENGAWVDL